MAGKYANQVKIISRIHFLIEIIFFIILADKREISSNAIQVITLAGIEQKAYFFQKINNLLFIF